MSEIKLTKRYPDSKPEDITDAYMRGLNAGMEIANSPTVRRIDALERRIEKLEADMFAQHAIAMNHSDSIEHIERKLQHKGGAE